MAANYNILKLIHKTRLRNSPHFSRLKTEISSSRILYYKDIGIRQVLRFLPCLVRFYAAYAFIIMLLCLRFYILQISLNNKPPEVALPGKCAVSN